MPTKEKILYLTFDDGPVAGPTDFALHTLGRFNAKATFFCIGDNVRKYPQVFRKIVDDEHAIGNHTYHHLNGWKTNAERYIENTKACNEEIVEKVMEHLAMNAGRSMRNGAEDLIPFDVKLFRPPYGRITKKQIRLLPHYSIVMWDVLSMDYNKFLSPETCLRNTINASRPGSIIVFHDSYKAERNMTYVLPRLMEHFTEAGYTFKAIK